MATKKFFRKTYLNTEKGAISAFFRDTKRAGIQVVRFSLVPLQEVHPNMERAHFQITAIEAY